MTISLPSQEHPMLSARINTPFVQELLNGKSMNVNGNPMSQAMWNLICSHRDLKMWCKWGMKPHRGWKISQAKAYFGLKGNKIKLLEQFEKLKAEVID